MNILNFLNVESIRLCEGERDVREISTGYSPLRTLNFFGANGLGDNFAFNETNDVFLLEEQGKQCVLIDKDLEVFRQDLNSTSTLLEGFDSDRREGLLIVSARIKKQKKKVKERLPKKVYQQFWKRLFLGLAEELGERMEDMEESTQIDGIEHEILELKGLLSDYKDDVFVGRFKDKSDKFGIMVSGKVAISIQDSIKAVVSQIACGERSEVRFSFVDEQ